MHHTCAEWTGNQQPFKSGPDLRPALWTGFGLPDQLAPISLNSGMEKPLAAGHHVVQFEVEQLLAIAPSILLKFVIFADFLAWEARMSACA